MEKKYKENKFVSFIKKNIYVILMVVCLLAIAGLITATVLATRAKNQGEVLPTIVDVNDNPVDTGDDQPKSGDEGKEEPKNGQPTMTADVMIFALPLDDAQVLKEYKDTELVYNATMKHWSTHQGIDYKAAEGTPVKAVYQGEVVEITTTTMRGTQITLKHSGGFSTVYALLGPNVTVKVGDKVDKGDTLGYVATTGYFESADEPHLHFETKRDGVLVDPNYYFADSANK